MCGSETYPMTTGILRRSAVASTFASPLRPPALRNSILLSPPHFDKFDIIPQVKPLLAHHHARCLLTCGRLETRGRLRRPPEGAWWHRNIVNLRRISIFKEVRPTEHLRVGTSRCAYWSRFSGCIGDKNESGHSILPVRKRSTS